MSDRPPPPGPADQQEKPQSLPRVPRVIRGFNGRFDTRPPPQEPQLPSWLFHNPSRYRQNLDALDARYRHVEAVVSSIMNQSASPATIAAMDHQSDDSGEEGASVEAGPLTAGRERDGEEWGSTAGTLVNVVAPREGEGEWGSNALTLVNGMLRQPMFTMAMISRGPYIDPEGGPAFMGWPDEYAVSSGSRDRSQWSPLLSLDAPTRPVPDEHHRLLTFPYPLPADPDSSPSLEYCPFEMEEDWLHGGTGIL